MAGGVRVNRVPFSLRYERPPSPHPPKAFSPQAKAAKAARLWLSVPPLEWAKPFAPGGALIHREHPPTIVAGSRSGASPVRKSKIPDLFRGRLWMPTRPELRSHRHQPQKNKDS